MAKKKRKKKIKKDKSLVSKKKIRKLLFRTALLGIGVTAGVLAQPSIVKDPAKRAQVEDLRSRVLQANDESQEKALDVLGSSSETVKDTVKKVSQTTKDLTNQDPQVIVEDAVNSISEEVKSLPEQQVQKIKLEFCKDLIEETKLSCQAD